MGCDGLTIPTFPTPCATQSGKEEELGMDEEVEPGIKPEGGRGKF